MLKPCALMSFSVLYFYDSNSHFPLPRNFREALNVKSPDKRASMHIATGRFPIETVKQATLFSEGLKLLKH